MELAALSTAEKALLVWGPLGVMALGAIYLLRILLGERRVHAQELDRAEERHRAEREALQKQLADQTREHRQEVATMVEQIREDNREQIEYSRTVIDRLSAMTESLERKVVERRR